MTRPFQFITEVAHLGFLRPTPFDPKALPQKEPDFMSPHFGTSGVRGLVTGLTGDVINSYVRAFIASCPTGGAVHVGRDLRPSSPAIARDVIDAVRHAGLTAFDHGDILTPGLALASMGAGHSAIMVTGSHIPADRNGLKFYTPNGEISKSDEQAILAALNTSFPDAPLGPLQTESSANAAYVARYLDGFGAMALTGLRIGIYEHSSVARDILGEIMRALGAETITLARSDVFIPVDTEAVDPNTRSQLAIWIKTHGLDAIVSTDGDGDRPMVTAADGSVIAGDVLGPLTASFLGADTLVTPVSSNSNVDHMAQFASVQRTRIGSPFVIATMEQQLAKSPTIRIAGYEANGGFLLGFAALGPAGEIAPLMTRDSVLPMVAPLAAAVAQGVPLAQLIATLPDHFTATDRAQNIPTQRSAAFIASLTADKSARTAFFEGVGVEQNINLTDGLRVTFDCGAIVHLRPSGNAPECRCYVEARSKDRANTLLDIHLVKLVTALT
jgi:phosphomannomutase